VLDRVIEVFERTVLSGGVMLMAATSIANVIGRNLLGHSLAAAEEINQMLIVLITFVGVGYAARQARHIRMTAVYDQLPPRTRKGLIVASTAGTALLLGYLGVHAVRYALQVRGLGSVTPVLTAPLWCLYAVAPIGLGLGSVQYLLASVRNLTSPGIHTSFRRPEDPTPDSGVAL